MRSVRWCCLVLVLGGCAAAPKARPAIPTDDAPTHTASDETTLGQKQAQQQQRISELEARIALLEVESRRMRGALASVQASSATVHIGAAQPAKSVRSESVDYERAEPEDSAKPSRGAERVPVLRLYGEARADLPELPMSNETLPVVPLPEDRASAVSKNDTANVDAATQLYRGALRALREQRYDDAVAAFDSFAKSFPDHELAGSALYWSGEAHYGRRDYMSARVAFDGVLARFAQSDKVPDALVKLGLSLRRLGDETQAQLCFRRVREKYPNTQAAVIALREGST